MVNCLLCKWISLEDITECYCEATDCFMTLEQAQSDLPCDFYEYMVRNNTKE